MSSASGMALGWWLARQRLQPWAWARAGGLAVAVLGITAVLRVLSGETTAGGLGLVSAVHLGLVTPLVCAHWLRLLTEGQGALLRAPLARLGGDRRALALGQALGAIFAAGVLVVPLGGAAWALDVACGHRAGASAAGVLVASVFALPAYVLACGALRGRWPRAGVGGFLLVDWLLGSGQGLLALPFPRASVRGLAGGSGPLEQSGLQCALLLVVIALASLAYWLRRLPR